MLVKIGDSVNSRSIRGLLGTRKFHGYSVPRSAGKSYRAIAAITIAALLWLAPVAPVNAQPQGESGGDQGYDGGERGRSPFIVPELEALLRTSDNGIPTLGVVPFDHRYSNVGRGAAALVELRLSERAGGRLRVISPDETASELKTQKLSDKIRYASRRKPASRKIEGFDFLILGTVREFDMSEKRTGIGPFDLPFVPPAAEARVRVDFAIMRTSDGALMLDSTVFAQGTIQDFKVPRTDTWKATLDFLSPSFARHPMSSPSEATAAEVAGAVIRLFPLFGSIVDVLGESVIVDFETSPPVEQGSVLDVYRIRSRTNLLGEVLWADSENKGTLRVLEVRGARAMCEIIRGRGEIAIGMKVRAADAD